MKKAFSLTLVNLTIMCESKCYVDESAISTNRVEIDVMHKCVQIQVCCLKLHKEENHQNNKRETFGRNNRKMAMQLVVYIY